MRDRHARASDLARGIEADELRVFYQPTVSAHSRQCTGFEALVRWQHPIHGLVMPDTFIPLAEEGASIEPLTFKVLSTALRDCAAWRRSGDRYTVAVNLSARLLTDDTFPAKLDELLDTHGVPPQALTLEITETALVERPDAALVLLRDLRKRGVRISVDDFGTGYTSLALLKRFEFDELKIDRSFVGAMLSSPADTAIVRSILELGHRLGLDVVAEGVEDEATARLLAEVGCDLLQGYRFARAAPYEDALATAAALCSSTRLARVASGAVPAPRPADEAARLAALYELDILDTDPEDAFDDVAAVAAAVCGTPVSLISFVDSDRQWLKANVGIDIKESDRDSAFCAHAILHDAVMEVPDATGDARFSTNPLVIGAPHIRFYAGAPLTTDDGHSLGTLCVLDTTPHTLSTEQRDTLQRLAAIVVGKLRARRTELTLRRLTDSLMELSHLHDPNHAGIAADAAARAARTLLGATGVAIFTGDGHDTVHYKAFGLSVPPEVTDTLLASVLDTRTDPATAQATHTRSPVFVPDAVTATNVDPAVVRQLDAASMLYIPIVNELGVSGVLIAWWTSPTLHLESTSYDAAILLAAKAGNTLSRLQAFAALRQAADTDALTGLANRRACLAALRQLPLHSAVVLLDLDRFKNINDSHGHQVGDRALKAFAAHLVAAVRKGDLVGRWDGEEFLIALPGGDTQAARDMLARLRTRWIPPVAPTTFSAGLATLEPGETIDAVLGRADQALDRAKGNGRNADFISALNEGAETSGNLPPRP